MILDSKNLIGIGKVKQTTLGTTYGRQITTALTTELPIAVFKDGFE